MKYFTHYEKDGIVYNKELTISEFYELKLQGLTTYEEDGVKYIRIEN